MTLHVRPPEPARLRDVPRLVAILRSFGREADWLPRRRSRLTDLRMVTLLVRRGQVQMLRDARGPVGFIARDGVRVHALYVLARGRGQGAGRRLLDSAKQQANRLELWTAVANDNARGFYTAQGFAEIQRSDGAGNDENIPDIHMVWQKSRPPADERQFA